MQDDDLQPKSIVASGDGLFFAQNMMFRHNVAMNSVRRIDLQSNSVADTASTGTETRTMALSDDGESLYVVDYQDGTISKVRTRPSIRVSTGVGITYDADTRQVWVANYAGSLRVFTDE